MLTLSVTVCQECDMAFEGNDWDGVWVDNVGPICSDCEEWLDMYHSDMDDYHELSRDLAHEEG
jgi:hypothetical protein